MSQAEAAAAAERTLKLKDQYCQKGSKHVKEGLLRYHPDRAWKKQGELCAPEEHSKECYTRMASVLTACKDDAAETTADTAAATNPPEASETQAVVADNQAYLAALRKLQLLVVHFGRHKYEWYARLLHLRDLYGMDREQLQLSGLGHSSGMPHFSNGSSMGQRNFVPVLTAKNEKMAGPLRAGAALLRQGYHTHLDELELLPGNLLQGKQVRLDNCFWRRSVQVWGQPVHGTVVGDTLELDPEHLEAAFFATHVWDDTAWVRRDGAEEEEDEMVACPTARQFPPLQGSVPAAQGVQTGQLVQQLPGRRMVRYIGRPPCATVQDGMYRLGTQQTPLPGMSVDLESQSVTSPPLEGEVLFLRRNIQGGGVKAEQVRFLHGDSAAPKWWVEDHKGRVREVEATKLFWPQYDYRQRPPVADQPVVALYRNKYDQLEPCLLRPDSDRVHLLDRDGMEVGARQQVEFLPRWELMHSPGSWARHFERLPQYHEPEITRWRNFSRGKKKRTEAATFRCWAKRGRLFMQCLSGGSNLPALEVIGNYTALPAAGNPRQTPAEPPKLDGSTLTFTGAPDREYVVQQKRNGQIVQQWYSTCQTKAELDSEGRSVRTWEGIHLQGGGGDLVVHELKAATRKPKPSAQEVLWEQEQQYENDLLTALWSKKRTGGEKFHQLLRTVCIGISRDRAVAWVQAQPAFATMLRGGGEKGIVMRPIQPTGPHQHQAVDLVFIRKGEKAGMGNENNYIVMVVVDAFSKFVWIKLLPSKEVKHVKAKFIEIWHGFHPPKILQSDQGTEFRGFMDELCRIFNIDKRLCSAYYSQCNGVVERVNKTLQTYLKRDEQQRLKLDQTVLDSVAYQYNSTPHNTLKGRSPFEVHMNIPQEQVMRRQAEANLVNFDLTAFPDAGLGLRRPSTVIHELFQPVRTTAIQDAMDDRGTAQWQLQLQLQPLKSASKRLQDTYWPAPITINQATGAASVVLPGRTTAFALPMKYVQLEQLETPALDHSILYPLEFAHTDRVCAYSGFTPAAQGSYFATTNSDETLAGPLAQLHFPILHREQGIYYTWQLLPMDQVEEAVQKIKKYLSDDTQASLTTAMGDLQERNQAARMEGLGELVDAYKAFNGDNATKQALKRQVRKHDAAFTAMVNAMQRAKLAQNQSAHLQRMGLPLDATAEQVDAWLLKSTPEQATQFEETVRELATGKFLEPRIAFHKAEKPPDPLSNQAFRKLRTALSKNQQAEQSTLLPPTKGDFRIIRQQLTNGLNTKVRSIRSKNRMTLDEWVTSVTEALKEVLGADVLAKAQPFLEAWAVHEYVTVQKDQEQPVPVLSAQALAGGGGQLTEARELVQTVEQQLQGLEVAANPEQELDAWVQSIGRAQLLKLAARKRQADAPTGGGPPLDLTDPAQLLELQEWYQTEDAAGKAEAHEHARQVVQHRHAGRVNTTLAAHGIETQALNMMRTSAKKVTTLGVNSIVRISLLALQDGLGTREAARKKLKQRSSCTDLKWSAELYRVVHHRFVKKPHMKMGMHEYMVEPYYATAPTQPSGWASRLQDQQLTTDGATFHQHYLDEADAPMLENEKKQWNTPVLPPDAQDQKRAALPYQTCWCHRHFQQTNTRRVWYNRVQLREVVDAVGNGESHAFPSINTLEQHKRAMFPPPPTPRQAAEPPPPPSTSTSPSRRSMRETRDTSRFDPGSGDVSDGKWQDNANKASGGGSQATSVVSGRAPSTLAGVPVRRVPSIVSGAPSTLAGVPVRRVPSVVSGAPSTLSGAPMHSVPSIVSGAPSTLSGAPIHSVPSIVSGAPSSTLSGAPMRRAVHAVPSVSGAPRNRYLQRFH